MTLRDEMRNAISADLDELLTDEAVESLTNTVMKVLRPIDQVKDTEPVVCYFATEDDREEFIQLMMEAKPNMRTVKV